MNYSINKSTVLEQNNTVFKLSEIILHTKKILLNIHNDK